MTTAATPAAGSATTQPVLDAVVWDHVTGLLANPALIRPVDRLDDIVMAIAIIPNAETVYVAEGAAAGPGSTGALLLELAGTGGHRCPGSGCAAPSAAAATTTITRGGTPGTQYS